MSTGSRLSTRTTHAHGLVLGSCTGQGSFKLCDARQAKFQALECLSGSAEAGSSASSSDVFSSRITVRGSSSSPHGSNTSSRCRPCPTTLCLFTQCTRPNCVVPGSCVWAL